MRVATLLGPLMLDTEHRRRLAASREDRASSEYLAIPPANIGDWFITRVTTELLDAEAFYHIAPDADDAAFDLVNAECDVLVLKGGNFIHRGWLERELPYDVLRKFKIPMVYLGAGCQAPVGANALELTDADVRSLKFIHDNCESSMVRGERTAEELRRLGIDNAEVIGCPTLFWSRQPEIKVRKPKLDRVGWTMRNYLFTDSFDVHKAQFDAIARLRNRAGTLTVMLQGEDLALQRYHLWKAWGVRDQRTEIEVDGTGVLKATRVKWDGEALRRAVHDDFGRYADLSFLDWIMNHGFFSFDIAEYVDLARSLDFVAGCRLHGNMVALAHGTPTFSFTYDERTRELAELMQVPHQPLGPEHLDVPVEGLDYRPFEARYAELFAKFRRFLERNRIRHTLQ